MFATRRYFWVALLGILLPVHLLAADSGPWNVGLGNAADQAALSVPRAGEPHEDPVYGPLSFRVIRDLLWVADSVRGRLLAFRRSGALARIITIPAVPENTLLEDFCVDSFGGRVWVADAADGSIRSIDVATGREMARCSPGNLRLAQVKQLEVDSRGNLFVWDLGQSTLVRFAPDGSLSGSLPVEISGFALDARDRIHDVVANPLHGLIWRIRNNQGRELEAVHLGLPDYLNPRIWGLTTDGALLLSVIPPGGFKGHLHLMTILPDGGIARIRRCSPPLAMNRFIDLASDGSLWLAQADFSGAPLRGLSIEKIGREGGRP